jgi:hypothetical protein
MSSMTFYYYLFWVDFRFLNPFLGYLRSYMVYQVYSVLYVFWVKQWVDK